MRAKPPFVPRVSARHFVPGFSFWHGGHFEKQNKNNARTVRVCLPSRQGTHTAHAPSGRGMATWMEDESDLELSQGEREEAVDVLPLGAEAADDVDTIVPPPPTVTHRRGRGAGKNDKNKSCRTNTQSARYVKRRSPWMRCRRTPPIARRTGATWSPCTAWLSIRGRRNDTTTIDRA